MYCDEIYNDEKFQAISQEIRQKLGELSQAQKNMRDYLLGKLEEYGLVRGAILYLPKSDEHKVIIHVSVGNEMMSLDFAPYKDGKVGKYGRTCGHSGNDYIYGVSHGLMKIVGNVSQEELKN